MAARLVLIAAVFLALAATLEQHGSLNLPTVSLADPAAATVPVESAVVGLPVAPILARDT